MQLLFWAGSVRGVGLAPTAGPRVRGHSLCGASKQACMHARTHTRTRIQARAPPHVPIFNLHVTRCIQRNSKQGGMKHVEMHWPGGRLALAVQERVEEVVDRDPEQERVVAKLLVDLHESRSFNELKAKVSGGGLPNVVSFMFASLLRARPDAGPQCVW